MGFNSYSPSHAYSSLLIHFQSRRTAAYISKFESELADILDSLSEPSGSDATTDSVSYLDWSSLKGRLLALGPQQTGPNLLFSQLRSRLFRLDSAWGKPVPPFAPEGPSATHTPIASNLQQHRIPFLSYGKAILHGFQVATEQGPLCAEPMRGVAFVLQEIYAEQREVLPLPRIVQPGVTDSSDSALAGAAKESKDRSEVISAIST